MNRNFPSTNKFFTFRYGTLWCAQCPNDNGLAPFPIKDKQQFLIPDQKIFNFEFNSTKKASFIQYESEIYVYVGLRKCSFKKGEIKCAHFSSLCETHLFVLGLNRALRILDIKRGEYVPNFEIQNVVNFAVFPKLNQSHYIAIITENGESHLISYIDSILLKDQNLSFLSNEIIIPPTIKEKDGIIQEHFIFYSSVNINIDKLDYDIIIGNTNVFIGSNKSDIFYIDDEQSRATKIDTLYEFQGFIENNEIFAITSQKAYLVDKNNLIEFSPNRTICLSISPQIISSTYETIYIIDDQKITIDSQNQVTKVPYEESKNLKKYLNDTFFISLNLLQIRGEKLKRRQDRYEAKMKKMIIEKNDPRYAILNNLKEKYNDLLQRLHEKVLPYEGSQIDSLTKDYNEIEKDFKNTTK